MELLIRLVTADLTLMGWLGTALIVILLTVSAAVCEAMRKATVTAIVERSEPGTYVVDRRRGRTIVVARPPTVGPTVAVVLVARRPS